MTSTFTQQLTEHIAQMRFPTLWERLSPDARQRIDAIESIESRENIEKVLTKHKFYIEVSFGDANYILASLRMSRDFLSFIMLFETTK